MKETIKQNFYEKLEKIREIFDTLEKELNERLDIETHIEVYVRTVPIGIEVLTKFYDFKTEKTYFCNSYIRDKGDEEIQDSITYENDNLDYSHFEFYVRTIPMGMEVVTRFYDSDEGDEEIQDSTIYKNDNLYSPHWVVVEHTKIMKQVKNVLFGEE